MQTNFTKANSDYYVGLDVGTNSIGWAVTDLEYNIPKFKGNAMWGVRLFEEAKTAEERRKTRTARRLNKRRVWRLELLELLFSEEISKIDSTFFMRLKESSLALEDKTAKVKFPLFNDANFTEKDFYNKYPTCYHLRKELIDSKEPHDIRLLYLAIHHIVKSRGHFLFDMGEQEDNKNLSSMLDDFKNWLYEEYDISVEFVDKDKFIDVLSSSSMGVTQKKKLLKEYVEIQQESDSINVIYALEMIAGATVSFSKLFNDDEMKNAVKNKLTLNSDVEADIGGIVETIGEDRLDFILLLKQIFDMSKLAQMLGNNNYICEAKIQQFETNKSDLKKLKEYVKNNCPEKYKHIFSEKKDKLNNFSAYGRRTIKSGEYTCNIEDFCKFLLKELPDLKNDYACTDIYVKISENKFLPKLKGSDNSVIPNQLHKKELKKILDNAEKYLGFLNKTDPDGFSVKEKILSIFDFRIPYYVGPLNNKSQNSWVVRTKDKIYPWNFEKVVDLEESSKRFIINLINKCPYTGDDVLPKESLLFSKYCVLNEINPLAVNGEKISVSVKKEIFQNLFVESNKKVTKKTIKRYLVNKGYIKESDEISGIDDIVKSKLKSYHNFSKIIDVNSNYDMVEDIIKHLTIFGDDKKLFVKWLRSSYPGLTKQQIDAILRLKYKDWGRLSKTILTEIYSPDENGEARSIIDMLFETNENFMQLLSANYRFKENADKYIKEKYGEKETISEMISDMYVSPAVKRSLLQTIKIVKEIVSIKKAPPKKIFIEVAREHTNDKKGQRTVSRKQQLLDLYKSCKKDYPELFNSLSNTDESALRRDKLYLYYTQFGKCMYSGQSIDLENLENDNIYDIDHIFPQSRIKDDSLDNRVLVLKTYNHEKGNAYPIKTAWRDKMGPFWAVLKSKKLISQKKYERLIRHTPLTEEELSSFVERQLVETRQSTKALAQVLSKYFESPKTKVVYSKAGNVSDFRQEFKIFKCRDVNDLHHAKDAYLNIVVGNVYDTKFTSAFFKNIHSENYSLNKVFKYDVEGAWKTGESIGTVKATVEKNNILVTRRPYRTTGALFDLTIMPAGKGQMPIKAEKSIEKYGGYNKVAGSFFCVVEHTDKKGKRTRSIETVYIHNADLFEKNPEKYCEDCLNLFEPKIIYKHLLFDSPIEIDSKRIFITGRTGNALVSKHDYQLSISPADEKYIKDIAKYVSRSILEKAPEGIALPEDTDISSEMNIKLYDLFVEKLKSPAYNRLFKNALEVIQTNRGNFESFSLINQCELLLEILKLFKCDRQSSDLSMINGASSAGIITINKNIDKCSTCFAINQSATGLFEYRTDLLKKS